MKTYDAIVWDGVYANLYSNGKIVSAVWHGLYKPTIESVEKKASKQGCTPTDSVSLTIKYKPLDKRTVTRKEINDALCRLERVSGTYYGITYSGTVTDNRGITVRPYDIEIYVKLDKPITVFSQERDNLTIDGGKVYGDLFSSDARYLTTINELWV